MEKQRVALTGKQSVVPLNSTDCKMHSSHLKEGPPKNINICLSLCNVYNIFGALNCSQTAADSPTQIPYPRSNTTAALVRRNIDVVR